MVLLIYLLWISDVAGLLSLFEKPDTSKLVHEVAIALMVGNFVSIPCAGGGSVGREAGMDAGRMMISDSVAGYMQQRWSKHPEILRQDAGDMGFKIKSVSKGWYLKRT